jgi:hypothetical protein
MPTLSNQSPLQATLAPSIDHAGRNIMVVLAKGTWAMSSEHGLTPMHEQGPLQLQDEPLVGEHDALRLCSELHEGKPRAEVLVVAPADENRAVQIDGLTIGVALGAFRFAKNANGTWPFGPLSRTAKERLQYAGTYDEAWKQQRMPLVPIDFDLRYHQAAPADQALPGEISGDEPLRVAGLHQHLEGVQLQLPCKAVLITGSIRQTYFSNLARLDTVLVWSDKPCLSLVWRLPIRPRQKIEEIGTIGVHMIRTQTARELYGLA